MPSGFAPLEIQPFKRYGVLQGGDGAGIGLKIAYSLAEYLSGQLTYDSSEEGTCFRLTIPALLQTDDPRPSPAESKQALVRTESAWNPYAIGPDAALALGG